MKESERSQAKTWSRCWFLKAASSFWQPQLFLWPGNFLLILVNDFVQGWLAWTPIGELSFKSYLPREENLLVPVYQKGLVLSPVWFTWISMFSSYQSFKLWFYSWTKCNLHWRLCFSWQSDAHHGYRWWFSILPNKNNITISIILNLIWILIATVNRYQKG